jgi:short chain dehydrogenase
VQVDLRTPDGVERLYRSTIEGDRVLTAAAVNAGIGLGGMFLEIELADDLSIVDLNVCSTVHLAKLVLRDMASRDVGKVLFTSVASIMPSCYPTVYNASRSLSSPSLRRCATSCATRASPLPRCCPGRPTPTSFAAPTWTTRRWANCPKTTPRRWHSKAWMHRCGAGRWSSPPRSPSHARRRLPTRSGRGQRKRASTGWGSLTPAELDVVRLVSEGLGNKDIATRLFVCHRAPCRGEEKQPQVHPTRPVGFRTAIGLFSATLVRAVNHDAAQCLTAGPPKWRAWGVCTGGLLGVAGAKGAVLANSSRGTDEVRPRPERSEGWNTGPTRAAPPGRAGMAWLLLSLAAHTTHRGDQ